MDWNAPYRADVLLAVRWLLQLCQQQEPDYLPLQRALMQTVQALHRWLLIPFIVPDERQRLTASLVHLKAVHRTWSHERPASHTIYTALYYCLQQLADDLEAA